MMVNGRLARWRFPSGAHMVRADKMEQQSLDHRGVVGRHTRLISHSSASHCECGRDVCGLGGWGETGSEGRARRSSQ